jgi:excisionase family DNA binding protein
MYEQFYTVEQIAQMLNIHPKTIQRYIREGKLRATKIGKSWRVTGHDLSQFTEENKNSVTEKPIHALKQERIKASAVIDIKVYSKDEANRIINSLTAAMNIKLPEYGQASMFAQFVEMDFTVRLTLWGNIQFMSAILSFVKEFLKQYEEEEK